MKPATTTSQILALSGLSVFCAFVIALGWEFVIEPIIDHALLLPDHDDAFPGLRWQFIVQATVFAALGMLPSIAISLKMARALRNALATESAARRAAEAAAQAKMRFLANVSHELRTPLNAVRGFSELAQMEAGRGKRIEYARIVHEAGGHLLAVVNDILDIAQADSDSLKLAPRTVDLDALLHEAAATFAAQAEKAHVALVEQDARPDAAITAWADEQKTRQAIFNLLSNAIKFTPAKGSIRLAAERHGARAAVTIHDSGIGIRPDEVERMFHPFEQADYSITRKFAGTDLGLPLARRFARAMGGDLTLTSAPGKGAWATLELPCTEAPAAAQPVPLAA